MIHVLNFNSQIIDFISRDDNAVTLAKYHKTNDNDLLDIRILSQRAEHFKKRNRIIIQDKNDVYREYIIDRAEEDGRYVDVECTASHLVDISTSKPIPPGKYEKMTINQKLSETLRDSGWVVGDCDYAGLKTNSWTSVRTPLEMISQLETAHEVQADYEIEIDGYEVVERRVNMKIPAPLFKGKEIEYGKDLLSMKRVIDFSEVKTALFALGPEPEQGKRVETFVYDDEAQEQFDLPYRYIWGVYEPETEDDNMSLQRLNTLAKTELNKRKSAAVSYEISVVDIEKEFPHEVIRYGDIVRIKNPDFTPALYAESEVVGIEHDLISNKCTYEFGKVVEYQEDDLLRYFRSRLGYFNQKFNDKFSNVNTIVRESIDGELQYFERKILKGDTPPDNPVNDLLWLDTNNSKVPVLRRYWNGEWIKSSAENANDVGAITREQALYSGLSNTFVNLTIQHSRLMYEVSDALESEYLVDTDIKEEINNKLNETIDVFNTIKSNLDSMTLETATIGKLIDTQALFVDYREKMQSLYNTVENAKIAIDERLSTLQKQFTEEKFNDAMEKIAEALPGGNWDAETGQLTSNIPNEERLNEIEIALQQNLMDQINGANQLLKNQVDAELLQLKDEITLSVRSVDEKIDGLGDGVNLLDSYNSSRSPSINKDIVSTKSFQGRYYATNLYTADYLKTILIPGETYTYSYEMEIIGLSEKEIPYTKKHGIIFYSNTVAKDRIWSYQDVERVVENKIKYTHTFVAPEITDHRFIAYAGFYTDDGTLKYPISSNLVEISNFKLERGTKATPYTESLNDRLEPIKIRTTEAENNIKVLQDSLLLTATKTDVQRTLDEQLKPLKNEVNEQKAQLQIMSDSIDSKVSQSEYTSNLQGVVERLDSAETHRQQLSDQITDRVTLNDYNSGIGDVNQTLKNHETLLTQNGKDIALRATQEEYNASKQLLEKVTTQVIASITDGVSLSYNDNGTLSDLVLNNQGVSLNSQLININQGDVVIENGVTTIKNLSSEKIKVAFNNISTSLSMTGNGLETWENGQMTSLLNGGGHHFYNNTFYVGYIGTSVLTVDSYTRGLSLSLQGAGNFMAFTYSKDKTNPDDASNVAMMWSKGIPGYRQGFFYNEDIVIRDTRVLETAYLRPYGMESKYRLMFSGRVLENQEGVGIQYNSVNGSGIHFSNASINIISKTKSGGWQGINVAGDYITSNTIYNRTYSSASNVYITSYGTLGRSTSASKYKLSQEKQFVDDQQQYNHSKQLLNLDIKTWFDRFESETYAREILTGERQENEDFKIKRYAGLIAEDVESVGLKEFVTYGKDKEIEGIEYDRLWIHLIPIVKKQNEEIEKLKSEMEVLKNGK